MFEDLPSAKTFGVRSKKCTLFLGKNLSRFYFNILLSWATWAVLT